MWWFLPVIFWSALAGGTTGLIIGGIISLFDVEDTVKREVKNDVKFKDAVKAIINDKKTRSVKVGIFASNNNCLGDIIIESEKGVSSDLRIGQVIYL